MLRNLGFMKKIICLSLLPKSLTKRVASFVMAIALVFFICPTQALAGQPIQHWGNVSSILSVNSPWHPVSFYEHLMESFCRTYLKDLFGLTYSLNSVSRVVVLERSDNNEVVSVYGVFSYSKIKIKPHNDVRFWAIIYDKGNNTYEVYFKKEVQYWIGDPSYESGTRTIRYSE